MRGSRNVCPYHSPISHSTPNADPKAAVVTTSPMPGRLAGLLTAPYLLNIWPFRATAERDCESTHAGWRRFLMLNYVTGFLVTQLLIWVTLGA